MVVYNTCFFAVVYFEPCYKGFLKMNNGEIHLDPLVLNSIDLNKYMLSFFILLKIKDYDYFQNKIFVNKKT